MNYAGIKLLTDYWQATAIRKRRFDQIKTRIICFCVAEHSFEEFQNDDLTANKRGKKNPKCLHAILSPTFSLFYHPALTTTPLLEGLPILSSCLHSHPFAMWSCWMVYLMEVIGHWKLLKAGPFSSVKQKHTTVFARKVYSSEKSQIHFEARGFIHRNIKPREKHFGISFQSGFYTLRVKTTHPGCSQVTPWARPTLTLHPYCEMVTNQLLSSRTLDQLVLFLTG